MELGKYEKALSYYNYAKSKYSSTNNYPQTIDATLKIIIDKHATALTKKHHIINYILNLEKNK